jgi:hypothetical protein
LADVGENASIWGKAAGDRAGKAVKLSGWKTRNRPVKPQRQKLVHLPQFNTTGTALTLQKLRKQYATSNHNQPPEISQNTEAENTGESETMSNNQ